MALTGMAAWIIGAAAVAGAATAGGVVLYTSGPFANDEGPPEQAVETPAVEVAKPADVTVQVIAGGSAMRQDFPAALGGFRDGPALQAEFDGPAGIALDRDGSLLVADSGNHRIRRLSPDGMVTTVAGSGEEGVSDGPAASATFRTPVDIAVGPDGTIYVVDAKASMIRAIRDGVVATVAGVDWIACQEQEYQKGTEGEERMPPAWPCDHSLFRDGDAATALFLQPASIAVAADGTLYVVDSANARIRVIRDGVVTTLAGSGTHALTDGKGSSAAFSGPADSVLVGDVLYVNDGVVIRSVASDGTVSTIAGDPTDLFGKHLDGSLGDAAFRSLTGIAAGSNGLCVTDNPYVRAIVGDRVATLAGTGQHGFAEGTGEAATFSLPSGIAVADDGTVYVADMNLNRIFVLRSKGGVLC
jgi:sugar lactone lactonase YvrE